jgi:hypothetical protein
LCRSIAIVHGGELEMHSLIDGCCFEFLLPLKAQPEQQAPELMNEEPSS